LLAALGSELDVMLHTGRKFDTVYQSGLGSELDVLLHTGRKFDAVYQPGGNTIVMLFFAFRSKPGLLFQIIIWADLVQ